MNYIFLTLLAYLIGSIPFGLLVGKMNGVDIRTKGSGNIGATNVLRVVGKGWGIFTLFLDGLKGFIPAFFFPIWGGLNPDSSVLFGTAALLGHTFPVYLHFKGGKGVATGAGMLLGIAPTAMGLAVLFWAATMFLFRYVSLASIVAALTAAIAVWVQTPERLVVNLVVTILALLVIWLHRSNIQRLLNGTENRFGKKGEK